MIDTIAPTIKPYNIYAPVSAIRAVYAAENNEGMMFDKLPDADDVDSNDEPDDTPPTTPPQDKSKRPTLRVVK